MKSRAILCCALLAACSQPAWTPIAQNSAGEAIRGKSSTGDALVYAFSDFEGPSGTIYSYPSGNLVGTFATGMLSSGGACTDAQGNVFFSGASLNGSGREEPTIQEYPYGATVPAATLVYNDSVQAYALSCSVDGAGNVAAIIRGTAGGANVAVFSAFQNPPAIYGSVRDLLSVGYDGDGNLFLLGKLNWYSRDYVLEELPQGGTFFHSVSVTLGKDAISPETVQWDGSHMTIKATLKSHGQKPPFSQAIYRLAVRHFKAKVVGTTVLQPLRRSDNGGPSWIQSSSGIALVATGHLAFWSYPAGGKELLEIKPRGGRSEVAVAVRAKSIW